MAFFKFRKKGDEQPATPVPPESIEVMRRRAKHRLIGAAVLVLIGVLGFPLLFDRQARPIAVDMPIEIPDRNQVKPLSIPAPGASEAVSVDRAAAVLPAPPVAAAASAPKSEDKVVAPPVVTAQAAPGSATMAKAELKPAEKPQEKVVPALLKADEEAKVQALLAGKVPEKKADSSELRYVVQVGAFSDVKRAREARSKLEHAGLKTYTQMVETKDGRRIRVRVGPYASKSEADKAAEKIKKLDLSIAVLTL